MRAPSPLCAALLAVIASIPAFAEPPPVPTWSKDELKTLFTRVEFAGQQPSLEAQDAEMARTMGSAYRVLPTANESTDGYARRVLKKIEPVHPDVKAGQWTLALARRFYADAGKRADTLSRLEPIRTDRQLLELRAKQSKAVVEQIGALLVTKLDTGGLMAPLPTGAGDPAQNFGCEAHVRGEKIEINQLDRMSFTDHRPPAEARRTPRGALKEFVASMKDFNMRAQTMGMIDPAMKQGNRKLRLFIPASHPALYLNELMRAAEEGGMSSVFFMLLDKGDGKMREIRLFSEAPKPPRRRKKGAPPVVASTVRCPDDDSIQACTDRLVEAHAKGPVVYDAP